MGRCDGGHSLRLQNGPELAPTSIMSAFGGILLQNPAQAGFSNPANGILTLESDNSLTIILQKNCQ